MSRLLPVAILLLAVLGGLFFLLPDDQGPHGSGDPGEPGSTPTAAETPEAGDLDATDPAPADGLTRDDLDRTGPGGDAGALAAAGASRVSLMLVGPDGEPADGAMVEAWEQQETDMPGFMLFDEQGEQRSPTHRVDAVDGRVDLPLAAGTAWRLDIKGSRWAPESLRVGSLAAGEQVDLGRVVLQQADRLEGEVVDADGRPVGGARVILTESGSSLFDGGGNVRVAYAEPDGRFHFDGIAAGRYKLEGRAAGHADGSLEPVVVAGEGGVAQAVLSLGAGRSVRGVVLNADNRPVPDAVISLPPRIVDLMAGRTVGPDDLPAGAVRSDAQGRFTMGGLGPEPATLRVRATGFAATTITEQPGGAEMVARLVPLLTVEGTLLLVDGSPAAELELALRPQEDEGMGPRALGLGPGSLMTRTDAGGGFRFEGLAPGIYIPEAVHPGGVLEEELLPLKQTTRNLELRMVAAQHLMVQVVGPRGPVAGARVRAMPAGSQGLGQFILEEEVGGSDGSTRRSFGGGPAPVQAVADAFGSALLPGLAPGPWELTVEADGFATARESLERDAGPQQVEVALAGAAALRVTVEDTTGRLVSGVEVILRPLDAPEGTPAAKPLDATTDAAGRVAWRDLVPGRYEMAYQPGDNQTGGMIMSFGGPDDGASGHVAGVVDLAVGAAEERLIVIDALATVEVVTLRDGVRTGGIEVWLEEKVDEGFFGMGFGMGFGMEKKVLSGPDGRAMLAPVEPGSWTLVTRAGRDAPQRREDVELMAGHQEFESEIAGAAVRGVLLGADGPVAGAMVSLEEVREESDSPRPQAISVVVMDTGAGAALEMDTGGRGIARVVTAADGSYLLRDVPPGEWQLSAKAAGHADWTSVPFTINGRQDQALGVATMEAESSISGVDLAFDPSSFGSGGGSFTPVRLEDEEGGNQAIAMPQTDGSYRFGGLPPGSYRVVRGSYRSELLALGAGQDLLHDLPRE